MECQRRQNLEVGSHFQSEDHVARLSKSSHQVGSWSKDAMRKQRAWLVHRRGRNKEEPGWWANIGAIIMPQGVSESF